MSAGAHHDPVSAAGQVDVPVSAGPGRLSSLKEFEKTAKSVRFFLLAPVGFTREHPAHSTLPQNPDTMDTLTLMLGILAATLAVTTAYAWRIGNDKRDIAFLGVCAGVTGLGTAVTAIA